MKMTTVTLQKTLKIGLQNYSNITVGMYATWEIAEGENFEYDKAWDIINQQLSIQADQAQDPSWMRTGETKDKYKATVYVKKQPQTVNYGEEDR